MNHHNSVALIVTACDGLYVGFVARCMVAKYVLLCTYRPCVGGGRSYWLLGMRTYLATNRR